MVRRGGSSGSRHETAGDSQRKPNLNKAVLEGEMRREDTMYLLGNKQDPSSCGRKGDGRYKNSAETSWLLETMYTQHGLVMEGQWPHSCWSEGIIPHILGKPFPTQYFLQRNVRKEKHNKPLAWVIFKGQKYAYIFTNFLYFQILFYKYYSCNGKIQQTCHYGLCLMIMKKIEGQQIVLF